MKMGVNIKVSTFELIHMYYIERLKLGKKQGSPLNSRTSPIVGLLPWASP